MPTLTVSKLTELYRFYFFLIFIYIYFICKMESHWRKYLTLICDLYNVLLHAHMQTQKLIFFLETFVLFETRSHYVTLASLELIM